MVLLWGLVVKHGLASRLYTLKAGGSGFWQELVNRKRREKECEGGPGGEGKRQCSVSCRCPWERCRVDGQA